MTGTTITRGLGMVGIDAIIDVINVMSRGQGRKDVSARWSLAPSLYVYR